MSSPHYQPAIEPQRTFGGSPFRLEHSDRMPQTIDRPVSHALQIPLIFSARFAPSGFDALWTKHRTTERLVRQRHLPVVKATGRIITQQEIDDALDY